MSTEFVFQRIDTNATHPTDEALRFLFHVMVKEAEYEYGHAPYSGTISEKDGLTIIRTPFADEDKAERWVNDQNHKWGDAHAVCFNDPLSETGIGWAIGGWCSS